MYCSVIYSVPGPDLEIRGGGGGGGDGGRSSRPLEKRGVGEGGGPGPPAPLLNPPLLLVKGPLN